MSRARVRHLLTGAGPYAALAALVLCNLFTPGFATAASFWNVLQQAAPAALVGTGMTLVMATGGVDLSVGSIMALGSAAAVWAMPAGPCAAAAAGLGAGLAVGLVNGVVISRYRVEPFIATLGTQIVCRGLAQVIGARGGLGLDGGSAFGWLGRGSLGPVPASVVVAGLVVAAGIFVTRRTAFGTRLVAVGGNPAAAHAAGVNVGRTRLAAYAVSGVLAALAGLVETARLGAVEPSTLGNFMEFVAIFGAVIGGNSLFGGRARVGATAAGLLILTVITASFNMLLIPYAWAQVLQAAIILAAVALQRQQRA